MAIYPASPRQKRSGGILSAASIITQENKFKQEILLVCITDRRVL